jgi:hypothetical protein
MKNMFKTILSSLFVLIALESKSQCNPVRFYPLDNQTAVDVIGDNNGLLSGISFGMSVNRFGQATSSIFSANANGSHMDVPVINNAQTSVNLWLLNDWNSTNFRVIMRSNSAGGDALHLCVQPNTRVLGMWIDGVFVPSSYVMPTTSTWINVTYIADGNNNQIYVNGNLVLNTTSGLNLTSRPISRFFNNNPNNVNQGYTQPLDDIYVFDRILTANEINFMRGFVPLALADYTITPACGGTPVTLQSNLHAAPAGVTYQWFKDGVAVPGATNPTYTIAQVNAIHAGSYVLRATFGCLTQEIRPIVLNAPLEVFPKIITDMQNVTICEGGFGSFGVEVQGVNNTYSWTLNGNPVMGDGPMIYVQPVHTGFAGIWQVSITNSCGTDLSDPAEVIVAPPSDLVVVLNPVSQTACVFGELNLTAEISGSVESLHWTRNNIIVPGQTTNNLYISSTSPTTGGQYRMVATDNSGCQMRTNSAFIQVQGMRHHYPIADGQAPDIIGTNNATVVNQANDANRFGTPNSAFFQANANGGVIDIQDVTANAITVSMWFKYGTAAPASGTTVLISPDEHGTQAQLVINNTNGHIGFFNGTYVWGNENIPRSNTIWRHVVYTSNGTTTRIILDGGVIYDGNHQPLDPNTVPVSRFINGGGINFMQGLVGTVDDIYIADRFVNFLEAQVLRGFQTAPSSHVVNCIGSNFTFSPSTYHYNNFHPDISFQWYRDGILLPGQTQRTLSINNVQSSDAGVYTLRMSMNCISVFSETVTVTVGTNQVPTISVQPADQLLCTGEALSLSVAANGSALSYQWFKNGGVMSGQTGSTLTIPSGMSSDAGTYYVVITNSCGFVVSDNAVVTITNPASISTQPVGQNLCEGNNYSLNVSTTGTIINYQWRKDGVNIPGATLATLNLTSVTPSDLGNYSVTMIDACGNTLTSTNAFITVTPLISITSQPTGGTVCEGSNFTLAVSAFDVDTYQWTFNGSPIAGATLPNYDGVNATLGNAGNYAVQLTNFCGTVTSDIANIAVEALPQITNTLSNQPLCAGQPLNLAVTATGNGLSYQWMKNGVAIPGANSATFNIASISTSDVGSYSVVVANSCGNATSNVSVVSVTVPAAITTQPTSHTACVGTSHTFTVNATGDNLNYNWLVNGSSFQSGPSASLSLSNISTLMAGTFQVEVSNSCGTIASNVVNLTVDSAPSITTQPAANTSLCAGNALNLSVVNTGGAVSYQWRKDGVAIAGATSATYQIASTVPADGGVYSVQLTNSCGTIVSSNATVSVSPATTITLQPVSATICTGTNHTFEVTANGSGLTYQWSKDGVAVFGATSNSLVLSNASISNSGSYVVTVTGACGTVTSQVATLTVVGGPVINTQPQATAICAGQNGSISVTASGPSLTYQWFKDGVAISGATMATYLINGMTASEAGNYTVTVSGSCGAPVTSAAAAITMSTRPVYTSQPLSNSYCAGETVNLLVTFSNSTTSIEWYKDGVIQQFSSSQELILSPITPANAGTYILNAMNNCGNTLSSTFTLTVNPTFESTITQTICTGESYTVGGVAYTQTGSYTANMQAVAGCDSTVHLNLTVLPTITNAISAVICAGDSYLFDGQALTMSNTYTAVFQAQNGCDSTVTLQLTVIDPAVPFNQTASICFGETFVFGSQTLSIAGVYTETFTSSAGCDSTVNLQLTVQSEITPIVTISGSTATVQAISGASYQWINCQNNAPLAGETSLTFSPSATGNYAVIVTVGDCQTTSACELISVSNVNLDNHERVELSVYPNPSNDFINIINIAANSEIVMFDQLGKIVYSNRSSGTDAQIQVGALESGVYFIHATNLSGEIKIERVVVAK